MKEKLFPWKWNSSYEEWARESVGIYLDHVCVVRIFLATDLVNLKRGWNVRFDHFQFTFNGKSLAYLSNMHRSKIGASKWDMVDDIDQFKYEIDEFLSKYFILLEEKHINLL